jgi:hypothetical protein
MSAETRNDARADLKAICDALADRRKPDPELVRRVDERAAKATARIYARHGLLDVAVDLIREVRDE